MNTIDQARKILRNTEIPWLELDMPFNVDLWKQQALEAEPFYQDYRESESQGWSSCCLHGLGVDKPYTADTYGEQEYFSPYTYTEIAYRMPAITEFWKCQFPAERYTRIRFMKVAAGGSIAWHNDGTIPLDIDPLNCVLPINLAIIHPENCTMVLEGHGAVPWKEGKIFLINVSKNHAVFNHGSKDRVHMIANVILGNKTQEFCNMLVRCYNKQYGKI